MATMTKAKTPRTADDYAPYAEATERETQIASDLAAVRQRIAELEKKPVGDEVQNAVDRILTGEPADKALELGRDKLREARRQELILVEALDAAKRRRENEWRAAVALVHGDVADELDRHLLEICTHLKPVIDALDDFNGFLSSVADRGAPLPDSVWRFVIAANPNLRLQLPHPASCRESLQAHFERVAQHRPTIKADLLALLED